MSLFFFQAICIGGACNLIISFFLHTAVCTCSAMTNPTKVVSVIVNKSLRLACDIPDPGSGTTVFTFENGTCPNQSV